MSFSKRILSGSLAGWASILVVLGNQVALVPIYLNYWTVHEYGLFVAIQALLSLCTVFSFGYMSYVEIEFQKSEDGKEELGDLVYSAAFVAGVISVVELLFVIILFGSGFFDLLIADQTLRDSSLLDKAGLLLVVQMVGYCFFTIVPNVLQRGLVPFGYYSRNAWFFTLGILITTIVAAVSVLCGADFLQTGVFQVLGYGIFSLFHICDIKKNLRKMGILYRGINPCIGLCNVVPSFVLVVKTFLSMLNQHGIRILLASQMSMREVATFSAMRTIGNVALQGIGTITNPLSPEIIRASRLKDLEKMNFISELIWFFAVYLLGFFLVLLQILAPKLFNMWTLGKMVFDPVVFWGISTSLLIYALFQPMFLIVRGENKLFEQLMAAGLGAFSIFLGIFLLNDFFGLRSVVVGLILSEIISLVVYSYSAKNILKNKLMNWPTFLIRITFCYCVVVVVGMAGVSFLMKSSVEFISAVLMLQVILFGVYLKSSSVLSVFKRRFSRV